jgi:hypothetical protein
MVTELDRTLLFDSVRFIGAVHASELIALVVNNENHTKGHQRRWKYKDQNPAAQRLNHIIRVVAAALVTQTPDDVKQLSHPPNNSGDCEAR